MHWRHYPPIWMSPSDYQSFIYFRAVSHKKRVYKSVTCHRFLASPLLEPVCWVTPVTRVFIIFVEVPITPVTQRYAENSGQSHIVFLFVCLFVSSKLGKSRGLLSDAEVLEDIIQRFLTAYLSTGDFSQLFQHHLEVFGYDVAAHTHVH